MSRLHADTSTKDDLHIAILKFGKDKLEEGVTLQELEAYLSDHGYSIPGKHRLHRLFMECYEAIDSDNRNHPGQSAHSGELFALTVESTFRLLEHQELQSANRSSRRATYFASAALVVAILSACFSIYYSHSQLELAEQLQQEQNNYWY